MSERIRTTELISESRTCIYGVYLREANNHTFSCPSASCFLCGGCFCGAVTEAQERFGAPWCPSQNRERREALKSTASHHQTCSRETERTKVVCWLPVLFLCICFRRVNFTPDWQPIDSPQMSGYAVQLVPAWGSGHYWYSTRGELLSWKPPKPTLSKDLS